MADSGAEKLTARTVAAQRVARWAAIALACALALGLSKWLTAQELNRAGLVVVHGNGLVVTRCIEFSEPQLTGYDMLGRSGLDFISEASGMGAAICRIDGEGCSYPQESCFCGTEAGGYTYWSYWRQEGDRWQLSNLGASNTSVTNGVIEGWVWGDGTVNSASPPPLIPLAAICATATPTPTETPTETPSPSATATLTPQPTPTATDTQTPTQTPAPPPPTATPTPPPTSPPPTATPTQTFTPAPIPQPPMTATVTPTSFSAPPTWTPLPTVTESATATSLPPGNAVAMLADATPSPTPIATMTLAPVPTLANMAAAPLPDTTATAAPSPLPTLEMPNSPALFATEELGQTSALPQILTFTADPPGVHAGDKVLLRWQVANAETVQFQTSAGSADVSGLSEAYLYPTRSEEYLLIAHNAQGQTVSALTIAVTPDVAPDMQAAALVRSTGSVELATLVGVVGFGFVFVLVLTVLGISAILWVFHDSN